MPALATIAATAAVTRLWPLVFRARPVTGLLIRDLSPAGYDLTRITTTATAVQLIERCAD